ncbi:MAG: DsbA family protein [bacterium]
MAMPRLDFYWSYRSPYSWLAMRRVVALSETYSCDLIFRLVRPLALREEDFFSRARPQFLPYLMRDCQREAQRLGMKMTLPNPDPVIMDMATGKVAAEQPLMECLLGLGCAAEILHQKGLALSMMLADQIWQGQENWSSNESLSAVCAQTGLDLTELQNWARANGDIINGHIAVNEEAQLLHHWGVPLMVLNDEPFFGQDRIDALEWRLQQT